MPTAIANARIVTPDETIERGTVLIDGDGKIAAVAAAEAPAGTPIVDATGLTLVPGFIDIHVHGGGGHSLATSEAAAIESYARWAPNHGVTSFLATIFASSLQEGLDYVRVGSAAVGNTPGGANLLGLNLEGPFVNPERRGALPESWILPPDPRTFDGIAQAASGHIKIMTFAPEMAGAAQLLRAALSRDVVMSVGHTDATYAETIKAFEAGATHMTHAFNAMRSFHHRDPGPMLAAMACASVTTEVIADGVHLHPATLDLLIRALGPGRVALVTDAVPPAGLATGEFSIGQEEAWLEGGKMTLADGTIAGGAATMDQLIRNVALQWRFVDLASAVRMASTVPATVLGLAASKGRIAPGFDADIVALDDELNVSMTWVGGVLIYPPPS